MPKFSDITLAILAGGEASRMKGQNKALLEIEGKSFISRIHGSLSPLFSNAIIISNDKIDYQLANIEVYSDIIKNVGPLGGIHSALENAKNQYVFIVSCDMPFADSAIAEILVKEFSRYKPDILLPEIGSFSEPLFAIYSKHLVGKIETLVSLSDGRSIKNLLKIANTFYFNLPESIATKRCFTNINSIEDLEKI